MLAEVTLIGDRPVFDSIDLVASNYLLPIGGLLVSLYAGWACRKEIKLGQLASGMGSFAYSGWLFVIRFVTPIAVGIVLLAKVREAGLFAWVGALWGG